MKWRLGFTVIFKTKFYHHIHYTYSMKIRKYDTILVVCAINSSSIYWTMTFCSNPEPQKKIIICIREEKTKPYGRSESLMWTLCNSNCSLMINSYGALMTKVQEIIWALITKYILLIIPVKLIQFSINKL